MFMRALPMMVISSVTRHWNQVMNSGASRLKLDPLRICLLRKTIVMETNQYRATMAVIFTYFSSNVSLLSAPWVNGFLSCLDILLFFNDKRR